jgi:hypothetical protein
MGVFAPILKKGIDPVEGASISIHPVRSDASVLQRGYVPG